VNDRKTTTPARAPGRVRAPRRRTHARPKTAPAVHHSSEDATPHGVPPLDEVDVKTELGGGGSSGRGPLDGDGGGGRRPDRDGDDSKPLLIALGILAVGAGVLSVRLLANAGRRTRRAG
jgi:hypothetical protein